MEKEEPRIEGWTPRHHRRDEEEMTESELRKLKLRNWLNILFMVTAVIGVGYYLAIDKTVGMYIVLMSMSIKIVEASMRMVK